MSREIGVESIEPKVESRIGPTPDSRVLWRDPRLLAIATGHGFVDFCASILPVFYPLLASTLGLSYAATSTLMSTQSTASALGQPFFGWLTDRFGTRIIAPASVIVTAVAISLAGFVPSYVTLLLVVGVLGMAIGAYHPQGAKAAAILGGSRPATSLSIHLILGNAGFALGPLVAAMVLVPAGLQSTTVFIVPGLLMAAWLLSKGPQVEKAIRAHAATVRIVEQGPVSWPRVGALACVILSRSWLESGLAVFLPLLYAARSENATLAGQTLFLIFLTQGPGTVVGGWAADRIGRRPTIIVSYLLLAPIVKIFLDMTGPSVLLVAPVIGFLAGVSATITILAAQEVMPSRMGVASGVATSLSMVMGAIGVSIQGVLADRYGLEPVMLILVGVCLFAATASVAIPRKRGRERGRE